MAQRRIGQEKLALSRSPERNRSPLDEIDALSDWTPVTQALSGFMPRPRANRPGPRWRCSRRY